MKNSSRIAVVADSSASLPISSNAFDFLYLVPMNVIVDGTEFFDKDGNSLGEFYSLMKERSLRVQTSPPSPNAYLSVFREIVSKSVDQIICMTVSSDLSGSYNSASIAAKEAMDAFGEVDIKVVDSKTAAAAEGLILLQLCRNIEKGFTMAKSLNCLESIVENTTMIGSIDNLHYAWKSGRIPKLAYLGANILRIKPVFELNKGEINVLARPRTSKKVNERFIKYISDKSFTSDVCISVMHADAEDKAVKLIELIKSKTQYKELFLTNVSPIIGAYAGPGMIGAAFYHDI
ncbi:MAG: DegV family protein [SAR202 cluster bacterium]|nr:DegV family protein [SAR202 cluster bacterium]|tara:strand:- start:300 stop:1169 length:870 start_codon:yes stop_codon:yes gene_type:complete